MPKVAVRCTGLEEPQGLLSQQFVVQRAIHYSKQMRIQCAARLGVAKRNTQSYITDLLRPFASPDKMDIESFVDFIERLEPHGVE